MISEVARRTAWLMPFRFPMLWGFWITRTLGNARAASVAQ
jgi:hypothetical protein